MAINLADEYVDVTPGNADYPGGSFKNESAEGAGDGTPVDEAWANDLWGFGRALLAKGGVAPSGTPDTALASQYLAALLNIVMPVGMTRFGFWTAVPNSNFFLECNGATIGNAASAANGRASADTWPLFSTLWPHVSLKLYTSAGAEVARGGSAAEDFQANRQLAIPDMRGRVPRGWDHGAGVDPDRLIASTQEDAIQNITGQFSADDTAVGLGAFEATAESVSAGASNDGVVNKVMTFDASRVVRTADETRMKNIAGMWIIRY